MHDTQALQKVMDYSFKHEGELGQTLDRFNGATRVDILRDHKKSILKSPEDLLYLINYLVKENHLNLSYGLQLQRHMVHFMLENEKMKIGIFYLDQKRCVSMKQVHLVEKTINLLGLDQGIILSNNYSIPSLNALKRANYFEPKIKTLYLTSIKKMIVGS